MSEKQFCNLMAKLVEAISGKSLNQSLEDFLNAEFAYGSQEFKEMSELIHTGDVQGWLMQNKAGDIRFGRAIKSGTSAGDFSVDVVRMDGVRGPHHIHPTGEIGAIIPISGSPQFDGKPAGWYVYEPGSAHFPTVKGGAAYVLYLLPDGAIEFTGK